MDNELNITKHNTKHNIRIKVNTNNNMKFVCSIEARATINQLRDKLLKVYEEISQTSSKDINKLRIGKLDLEGFILPREETVGDLLADYDEINCEVIAKANHHQQKKKDTRHQNRQSKSQKKQKHDNQEKPKKEQKHKNKQENNKKTQNHKNDQKSNDKQKQFNSAQKSGQPIEPKKKNRNRNRNKNKNEDRPLISEQEMKEKKQRLAIMLNLHKSTGSKNNEFNKQEK